VRLLERNTAILESIQDAFVAFDEAGRFTYANRHAAEMLGFSPEELLGRTVQEMLPGLETPILDAGMESVRTNTPKRIEQYSPALGRWLEARFYPANGAATVFFQDVSQRHRQQVAAEFLAEASRVLASSLDYEATLRAVARAAVPTLADWCAVDVLVDPSSGAWPPELEHVAIEHQDPARFALGMRLRSEYPTDWSDDSSGVAHVLRTGKPMFIPVMTDEMLVAGARDAAHLELMRALEFTSIIVVPLVARGRTLGVLTLCMTESRRRYDETDLTIARDLAQRAAIAVDNARLFRDAQQARAEAEAASHAKTQFLATMSHELRTPLNAIAGYADLLDVGVHGPLTAEQHADLERLRRSQRHLLLLVDDVLNLARIEAGRVEYAIADVRVSDVFETVVALIEPQAAAHSIALDVSLDDPSLTVRADREKAQQVVLNLASNAVKFTEAGGRIALDAETRDGFARLHVRDTGRGIPADKLEQIFHPFVQVESGLTRTVQGSGLGLAIARDLARGMGGDVTVESVEGVGSDFVITLPRARGA
jgi:PAS domain S-box-containing protein